MNFTHIPVLLHEAVDALNVKPAGVYVDGTFGRGGHSREILSRLSRDGRLIGIDRDPEAEEEAKRLEKEDPRFRFYRGKFSEADEILKSAGVESVDGALLDLGISSPQIDEAERGFSFQRDGALDMRMDPSQGESAAEFLANAPEKLIAKVLKDYGEERFAPQIARAIVAYRSEQKITRTSELSRIVRESLGSRVRGDWKQNPATRVFQALRIEVNDELGEVERALPKFLAALAPGGRFAVITFHSLEDRIVKRFFASMEKPFGGNDGLARLPIPDDQMPAPPLKPVGHAIKASEAEVASNARARSATLRVAEKSLKSEG